MSFLKIKSVPVPFLLYTEWIILAICASFAVMDTLMTGYIPIEHLSILGLLGLMGLALPSDSLLSKVVYTATEMGLVFYGTTFTSSHTLPTLYLIVAIRRCFIFSMPGRWATTCLSLLLFSIHELQYISQITPMLGSSVQELFWVHQFTETLLFAIALIFLVQFVNTWLSERESREQLAFAHQQLQQYALEIEDLAAVQERNRIARDIHDSLGHVLTTLNVQLQAVGRLWDINPGEAKKFYEQSQRLGDTAIKEVRLSVHTLRADTRDEVTLEAAIADLIENFRQSTGITISKKIETQLILSPQTVKTLYRVIQETLTNICKHAQATEVQLQLQTSEDRVYLTIEDNGQGFFPEIRSEGFGLQGMRERVAALGGQFQLVSQPGAGCRTTVELPLP